MGTVSRKGGKNKGEEKLITAIYMCIVTDLNYCTV